MMSQLAKSFHSIKPFRALVLGDFVVDTYTSGKVKRISPEAPVQVLEVLRQESKPGGAGNAAKNIAAMGAHVTVMGRIGDDFEGRQLREELAKDGIDVSHLLALPSYRTPVKNRLIAESQQLLRVDFETITPLESTFEPEIIERLRHLIPTVQVVAISDYGKGFLTTPLLTAAIHIAKQAGIPLIVDPKGTDFSKYRGATVLKPNSSEAYAAAKLPTTAPLEHIAQTLLDTTQVDYLLITRSEAGISLFEPHGKRADFPVRSKEVKDVTGAGDTVLAALCLSLANGLDMASATQLANIAAGIAIERFGCVQVTLSEIAARLLPDDADSKVFDEHQTHLLAQILQKRSYALLILEKTQSITRALLQSIRHLAKDELLIHIADGTPQDDLVAFLSSLQEVRFLSLGPLNAFQPRAIFKMEDGELQAAGTAILGDLLQQSSSVV